MVDKSLIGRIIQCHIDKGDPDTFVVGLVAYADDNWFLMKDILPNGYWNGFALYPQTDVVSIEKSSEYLQRVATLVRYRKQSEPHIVNLSSNPPLELLAYAGNAKKIVGIEICSSGYRDVNGIVSEITNDTLVIRQLDEYGRDDGVSYISIDSITRCYLDDEESEILTILSSQLDNGDEYHVISDQL